MSDRVREMSEDITAELTLDMADDRKPLTAPASAFVKFHIGEDKLLQAEAVSSTSASWKKSYRIYVVGSDGKYLGLPRFVNCFDDEEAVATIIQPIKGIAVEIWEAARIVARLPLRRAAGDSKRAIFGRRAKRPDAKRERR
jgi:hypothetical protein